MERFSGGFVLGLRMVYEVYIGLGFAGSGFGVWVSFGFFRVLGLGLGGWG